jgi:hypothetical protein
MVERWQVFTSRSCLHGARAEEQRMTRLSVAFFGLPRGHLVAQPALDRWLEALAVHFDLAVSYHLYRLDRVVNTRSGEDFVIPDAAYAWFERFDGEVEAPRSAEENWNFADIVAKGDPYQDGHRSIRSLLAQLRSLRAVTRRVQAHRPDAVLFLRPDLLYHSFPDVGHVERVVRWPDLCLLPDWHWWDGYNDRFAVCGARSQIAYGGRADVVGAFLAEKVQGLEAESLIRFALRKAGTRVRSFHVTASRVRELGRVQTEVFDPRETLGGGRALRLEHAAARWLPDWAPI